MDQHKLVSIDYTASNGRRYVRTIEPIEGQITFNYAGREDSLPEWAIIALDISGDGTLKTFKLARIHSWTPVTITSYGDAPNQPQPPYPYKPLILKKKP